MVNFFVAIKYENSFKNLFNLFNKLTFKNCFFNEKIIDRVKIKYKTINNQLAQSKCFQFCYYNFNAIYFSKCELNFFNKTCFLYRFSIK